MTHRQELFERYEETHARFMDGDAGLKAASFRGHIQQSYLPHLPHPSAHPAILEIGCSKGFMLAALREEGYPQLTGIDLSAPEIEFARETYQLEDVHVADAFEFLDSRSGSFDVIVTKAVLEHVDKKDVFPFLRAAHSGLRPGGRLLVEVPNMDWLFSGHERYLDFTHEGGFTRESLGQVLRAVFGNAEVHRVLPMPPPSRRIRLKNRLLRPLLTRAVNSALRVLGSGEHSTWWDARSILGVSERRI